MKNFFNAFILSLASLAFYSCGGTSSGVGGATPLTTAGKMSTGIGSAVTTMQSVGNAMGGAGTFSVGNEVSASSASNKCTSHAEPGTDANSDGTVSDAERMNNTDIHYALQKFYCTLAANSTGPESVSGAVSLIKTVACAVDRQTGGLTFNNSPVAITGITLDLNCATQAQINSMSGTTGQSSVVMTISGGATVTSALNPTFAEVPSNTHYTHGIKIASTDGTTLKFIILAKFDASVSGNPIDSGEFEFATLGTGTMMQGTAIEFTAGKISGGSSATKHLWYESRSNRAKTSGADPICPGTSGSCGFMRHIRISTDIAFSGGDVSSVSNMSGIMTDGGDSTGSSGQMDNMVVVTATGSLASGLTGKFYSKAAAPSSLAGTAAIGTVFSGGEIGSTTCIMSSGSSVTTSCGGAPAPLSPTGNTLKNFFLPANASTWIANASTKAGIGFSGAASLADEQFVNP